MKPSIWCAHHHRHRGVTLIELMVSMLLGLVIIGGATGVILANRQSYRANEALSQVQESARTAFELLSRDVREAGISGCNNNNRVANVLDPADPLWWQNWFGIAGFDGNQATPAAPFNAARAPRIANTDAILMQGIRGTGLTVQSHDPGAANFKINAAPTDIVVNDILVVCDFDHATMFQVTRYNQANAIVGHDKNLTPTMGPGNCLKNLGYPAVCSGSGTPYTFLPNSQIARLSATAWYIGNNTRAEEGGRSLYRVRLDTGARLVTEEVVAGVTDMRVEYREQGGDVDEFRDAEGAESVGNWANVNAVRITLTLRSADRRVSTDAAVNAGRLERTFTHIVTLRNRVP